MLSQSYNSTVPPSSTPPPPARYHISLFEASIAEQGLSPPFLLVKPGGETVATLVSENTTEDYVHNIAHKASFSNAGIPRISSFLRTRGLRGTQPYYRVSVPVNEQTQNRVFLFLRLWHPRCGIGIVQGLKYILLTRPLNAAVQSRDTVFPASNAILS